MYFIHLGFLCMVRESLCFWLRGWNRALTVYLPPVPGLCVQYMFLACTHSLACDVKMERTVSLFISADSCFCLRAAVVFQLRWQNNRQQFKDKMVMDECSSCSLFDVFTTDIFVAILLCSTSVFYMLCPDSVSLSLSYLYPPQLLLAGCSGAEKFGRDQAKGGQTGSLCVYIEEQETVRGGDGVASTDRVQWRNGGGLPKIKYNCNL